MKAMNAALAALVHGQRKALLFDGSDDFVTVSVTSNPELDIRGDVTVEFWLNPYSTTVDPDPRLVICGTASNALPYAVRWNKAGARPVWEQCEDAATVTQYTTADGPVPADKVVFLSVVRKGTKLQFYKNGLPLEGEKTVGTVNLAAAPTVFRAGATSGSLGRLNGIMDEVRVYARALSADEIAQHYIGRFENDALLKLWWPFDEGTGTTAFDLSGNSNDGTLTNGPAYQSFNPYPGIERGFRVADLLTMELVGGLTVRYCSADIDILSGGNTFKAARAGVAPIWKRGGIRLRTGLEVDELDLVFHPTTADLLSGQQWLPAVRDGVFDGAKVTLQRAFMPAWGNVSAGTLIMFTGIVGDIEADGSNVEMKVLSDLFLLNIQIPRNLYQPGCLHTLYDSGCALSKTAFESISTAASGSTRSQINCSLPQASGFFDLGTVLFTSGPNNGVSRTIKSYSTGQIILMNPLPSTPGVGDSFKVYPGCDKLQATCGIRSAIVFTRSGNLLLATAHGLKNDEAVFLASTGTLPDPLSPTTRYFVVNANANDFQVALTLRGTPITLTLFGTGTHTVAQHGKFANIVNYRGFPYIPVPETVL